MNGTGLPFVTVIEGESSTCTTAYLVDQTIQYGQGSYPARNQLALYLYLNKRDINLVDTPIAVDNTTPLTVSQWLFNLLGDGWYTCLIFGFRIWAASTYTINQCVYYNGSYYRATGTTSSVPNTDSTWSLITNILSTCLDLGTNVEQTQTNNFTVCNGSIKAGNILQPLGQQIVNGKCRSWEDAGNALFVAALIQSAVVNHRRLDDLSGQEIMDFVNNRFAA